MLRENDDAMRLCVCKAEAFLRVRGKLLLTVGADADVKCSVNASPSFRKMFTPLFKENILPGCRQGAAVDVCECMIVPRAVIQKNLLLRKMGFRKSFAAHTDAQRALRAG